MEKVSRRIQKKLEMERVWQEIHFILTGEGCFLKDDKSICKEIDFPKIDLMFSGKETKYQTDYGHACYLNPKQIQDIVKDLSKVSEQKLKKIIVDSQVFTKTNLIDNLLNQYYVLAKYFQDASNKENAILIYFI